MTSTIGTDNTNAAEQYARDGFVLAPQLLDADLVTRVDKHMDAVIAGDYETGEKPFVGNVEPGERLPQLVKIDQPQYADNTIREAVTHPEIGRWAAAITGAKRVQV